MQKEESVHMVKGIKIEKLTNILITYKKNVKKLNTRTFFSLKKRDIHYIFYIRRVYYILIIDNYACVYDVT